MKTTPNLKGISMPNQPPRLRLLREGCETLMAQFDSFLSGLVQTSDSNCNDSQGIPSTLCFELSSETHSEAT